MITSIIALAALALFITGKATKSGIKNREYKKDEIRTLLWEPVYLQGMSLEAARAKYPEMYRQHPALFVQYYQDLHSMRSADLGNDIHPLAYKKNEKIYQEFLALGIIVIMLLFINNIYN